MSVLGWIMLSTLAGALISVFAAAGFSLSVPRSRVSMLISYAVGALLGAVFLEILPHALEETANVHALTATVLGGILGFFILEKLVLWRHCHVESCEAHDRHSEPTDDKRSGLMILIGDTIHNFVDGILIAAAFLTNVELGIVTAVAMIAHEIPQEVGDFLILLHSGFSRTKALIFNLLSSGATLIGALLAWIALQTLQSWVPPLLALAAASMIYVAVADLIPGLHRRPELRHTVEQVTLIGLGIFSIAGVKWLAANTSA
ncbi:MAG TPA: ZIP family metal transporter [Burkholderiales bacterium]|jgi:zinc and cadmium transporter|nr:ZIP family metal transporter [Burkholderiales bacterium]